VKITSRPSHEESRHDLAGRLIAGRNSNGQDEFEGTRPKKPNNAGSEILEPGPPKFCAGERGIHWLVWQIADSAFPTGGFAHSNGLESTWQQGEIRSPEELAELTRIYLAQIGRSALPFVNEAYHQSQPFADLDRLYDAFVSNHVANRGSRAQGQAFLLASAQSFSLPSLIDFRAMVLQQKVPGHFAPIFGNVFHLLKISHAVCVRLFLFMNLRGLLASAVRLGIAGPMAAQSLQSRLEGHAEEVAQRSATAGVADAAQISPLLDILHGAHDRLYSRLFQT
jgi:urease accessory protein